MRNIALITTNEKNLLLTYKFQMDSLLDESTQNTPTYVLEDVVLSLQGKRPPRRPKIKDIHNWEKMDSRRRKLHETIVDNKITTRRFSKMLDLMIKNKK